MNSVWLRLQGDALDLGGNGLVIGAIYAAPLGSRVYSLGGRSSQDSVTRRVMDRVRALVRRFQQPGDEVLMLGDLNARVAGVSELPDVDGDAELAEFTQAELGQANLLRAIPPRRSEDTSDNVFGRALAALCQELELVVLNGRVNGDPQGACTFWSPAGQGRSMIDLFVASPALFFRADRLHVTNIPVAQSGVKVGSLMSDHCPVSLDLRVLRQGASPAGRSSPRARFDVRRKARYASLFAADDAPSVRRIADAVNKLGAELDSTAVVEVITMACSAALEKAFGGRLSRVRRVREDRDAPWWTDECATARNAMLQHKAYMRAHGLLADEQARLVFSTLRTRYQRLRKDARAAYSVSHFTSFLEECKGDPRALWRRLNQGLKPDCPIRDVNSWREYFDALYNDEVNAFSAVRADYILNLFNGRPLTAPRNWAGNEGVARNQRVVAAASLNAPFSLAEVIAALKSLANHKSPGLERAPAECYKYATRKVEDKEELVLAPYLLRLLEHIRSTGDYPKQFEVSIVTPLHKKGDALDPSNYRGLAVGGALSKLYANLLDRRLKAWGESSGARSPYQGGFRPKRGTIHNLFLLRHLTDRCRRVLPNGSSQALFVCQIDFEKAFDRVNRDMLWLRLEERGVTGAALAALKRCYERVELRVKVNGTTGAAFPSSQGVKQGCPMSPTLFGFFVEGYADYVDALDVALPDAMAAPECPDVEGRRVPLALYADDLSLFAATKRRLMSLLRALREWSEVFGLTVNARKCELLLFHPSDQVRSHFYAINGLVTMRVLEDGLPVDRPITWKPRARYLGLHFGPNSSFASCTDELYVAGQRAMFSLLSKLRRQGLLLPFVGMKCFNAQVRSVLSYGSQLWGVDLVLALLERGYPANEAPRSCYFEVATRDRMVKLQIAFMKQLVGASVPPLQLLFRELGQMPLQMYWAESVFRFWNSMVENTSSIYHSVFRHEIRLALESDLQGDGWGTKIIRALNILRHDWPEDATAGTIDARVRRYSTCKLDVEALLDTLRGRINDDWASDRLAVDPCSFVTDGRKPGVKMCRHKHWMGQPKQFEGYIPPAHHRALLRFRLCVSDLAVNSESNRARELRVCKACRINGAVEDEKHFLMECSALVSARQKLWDLGVPEGASVCDVMQIDDQRGLAKVVYDMFCFRRERIAV
ncbi:hypothetical protein PLESTB_001753600 [Pleodorina starrii]|uniref:Reverse transcriptase domain-containing protein n=1 Tax=Pleodorina starrii TaxID=330485 RepID=A0A9W6F9K0_9CHLO|nr:hypothetical protein PLESTM_000040400 [Pleodorina starrii]GLC50213.1 hypothetical protein PLESTB_000354900 [Pleodorina starrii]GLC61409.1 hypothetical protein PLESTB_001753600 [Pleodorina starrii]